jgi:hypothetical protein
MTISLLAISRTSSLVGAKPSHSRSCAQVAVQYSTVPPIPGKLLRWGWHSTWNCAGLPVGCTGMVMVLASFGLPFGVKGSLVVGSDKGLRSASRSPYQP